MIDHAQVPILRVPRYQLTDLLKRVQLNRFFVLLLRYLDLASVNLVNKGLN